MRNILYGLIGLIIVVGTVAAIGLAQGQDQAAPNYTANVIAALSDNTDTAGFARAETARPFQFPLDYGAHPDFQTEWWYYTGNLADSAGRRFGFEFTIFRRALSPTAPARQSEWATNQIYFADLALTDVQGNKFYSTERFSRGAAGLAGATTDPSLKIWIEDWSMAAQNPDATLMHLQANNVDNADNTAAADAPIALDLTTKQLKPPALEGDRGLSAKSTDTGNASYYYSLTRLDTTGTVTIAGQQFTVSGLSWMDHEFSTSALSKDAVGWDWFSLQLSDGREIMLYRIRRADGSAETTSDGTLIAADGSTQHLTLSDFSIQSLATWHSPFSGTDYPAKWQLTIHPAGAEPINLTVTPLLPDQELHAATTYWEGASQIAGTRGGQSISGYGYVELTGYNTAQLQTATPLPLGQQPH